MVLTQSSIGLIALSMGVGFFPGIGMAATTDQAFQDTPPSAPVAIVAQAVPAFISPPTLNVLPVPDAEIPVGNIDGMPTISIPRDATQGGGVASPGLNRATSLGLSYRVVVSAPDEQSQESVRSLVPDAFRTWFNGQTVMQVGAYAALENAQETIDFLGRYGIQAVVLPVE